MNFAKKLLSLMTFMSFMSLMLAKLPNPNSCAVRHIRTLPGDVLTVAGEASQNQHPN